MSSKKKESEGIALLSMYYADEEEEDDDDIHTQIQQNIEEDPLNNNNNNIISGSSVDPLDAITETPEEEEEEKEAFVDISPEDEHNEIDKFLPSPPNTKCSDQLQEKIIKFLLLKNKTGRSFNSEVRNRKEYRNPDFLLHAVTYQDIDQIGTCFSPHVFDPHGYNKSDYYDKIEADLKRELERKEQDKKKNQKIDFLSGGTQSAIAIPTPKVMPFPAVAPVSAGVDTGIREGRPHKKSKWDKVDGDTRHPLITSGQDSVSHAANAGSGYTAFAKQRRKAAVERRPSDRKLDRRS